MKQSKAFFTSAIMLYFVIALEFLIMISPFAGFFYSVFNPVLIAADRYPATRWLSAFFLPHMVVPPDALLKLIRVMGSVLLVTGVAVFLYFSLRNWIVPVATVIVGGMGNLTGTFIAAMALGMVMAITGRFYSQAAETMVFIVMGVVLVIGANGRPCFSKISLRSLTEVRSASRDRTVM